MSAVLKARAQARNVLAPVISAFTRICPAIGNARCGKADGAQHELARPVACIGRFGRVAAIGQIAFRVVIGATPALAFSGVLLADIFVGIV